VVLRLCRIVVSAVRRYCEDKALLCKNVRTCVVGVVGLVTKSMVGATLVAACPN
jgi:hypothetical protein